MKTIATLLFILSSHVLYAQHFDPDSILTQGKQMPSVLLVGTFHFAYYNLDAHKTDASKQLDILSAQRQKELKELLDYIARFKPNKIAFEATPQWHSMEKYRKYQQGQYQSEKDERFQIAFRLMNRFHLDTAYAVDAESLSEDLDKNDRFKPFADSIYKDWDFNSEDPMDIKYRQLYDYQDSLSRKLTLLNYFKYLNAHKSIQRSWGAYLVGDFKLGEYRGTDALAMHFYSRNLRIFRNIQRITTSPSDRILVLFGAGHMAVLQQLFECSPEYKLIPFSSL